MRRSVTLLAVVAVLALVLAACGNGRGGGRRGEPTAVVRAAPDRTIAAGRARVEAAAPDAQTSATIALSTDDPRLTPAGRGSDKDYPELRHPAAVIDLLRGAVGVESYGGVAVRGVSTFRYETVINVERAVAATPTRRRAALEALVAAIGAPGFYADVWVDDDGRVRRVQLPVEKTTKRPAARDRRQPRLITVDFFDFGRR